MGVIKDFWCLCLSVIVLLKRALFILNTERTKSDEQHKKA